MAASESRFDKRGSHFIYIWQIEHAPRSGISLSPEFMVHSMEKTKWTLAMGVYSQGGAFLCLARAVDDKGPDRIEVEFELSFLDNNGASIIEKSNSGQFRRGDFSQELVIPQTHALFKKRKPMCRPRDTLTIRCCMTRTGTEISKSKLCFATTHFEVHKRSCFWVVKGLSTLRRNPNRCIRILKSNPEGCPRMILILLLYKWNHKEYISIELQIPHVQNDFDVESEIAVLNADGMVFLSKRTATFFGVQSSFSKLGAFEKDKLLSNGDLLLLEDVLILRCELRLTSHDPAWSIIDGFKLMHRSHMKSADTEKSETSFEEVNETAVCPFKEIVNSFKNDETLSDVCLRAGNTSFPVHKLILSCRSPVFRAMFTTDMREKTSTCIDIPDTDAGTLHRLLLYIYENKLEKLTWEMAANLFEAADRYEITDLSKKCSNFLKSNLSESNVCDILVLADMHHNENLRKSVHDFILKNSGIIYSDGWKLFKEDHSKLAWETAEEIIYMKRSTS